MSATVDEQLARLPTLSTRELQTLWGRLTGGPVPRVSARMLRLALAWEIQATAYGGLKRETIRLLDQLERRQTRTVPPSPGMRLIREWQGRAHIVLVGEDKIVRYEGREYGSLSEVARAITGTRWSGPAFFGLKRKAAA